MGNICSELTKLEVGTIVLGLFVAFFVTYPIAFLYGNDIERLYGTETLLMASFFVSFGLVIIYFGIEDLSEFMAGMDPNEILSECLRLRKDLNDQEKLEKAYSLATQRAYSLFVNFLSIG